MYQQLPKATVKIFDGENPDEGFGSGFHLRSSEIVVTNAHVVLPFVRNDDDLFARTESGEVRQLSLVDHSPADERDFAVMTVEAPWDDSRQSLEPDNEIPDRGENVLFSGFPFGKKELLVHKGVVSGPSEGGFSIDGAVNKGNSGGPVVSAEDETVQGIITLKGSVQPEELEELHEAWSRVYFAAKNSTAKLHIGSVDQQEFNKLVASSFDTLNSFVETSSTTGIGRAFEIEPADSVVRETLNVECE